MYIKKISVCLLSIKISKNLPIGMKVSADLCHISGKVIVTFFKKSYSNVTILQISNNFKYTST